MCFVFKFVPGLQNVLDDQNRMEDFLEREVPQQLIFFFFRFSSISLCLMFKVERASLMTQNVDISLKCCSLQLFLFGQKCASGWTRYQVGSSQTWDSELGSKVRGSQVPTTHS